jgi:threonine dehydrogenase-like Zn-dependent dehydrogenase
MGLMMLELAKRTGAASVDVIDINPSRLENASGAGRGHISAPLSSAMTWLDTSRGLWLAARATSREQSFGPPAAV